MWAALAFPKYSLHAFLPTMVCGDMAEINKLICAPGSFFQFLLGAWNVSPRMDSTALIKATFDRLEKPPIDFWTMDVGLPMGQFQLLLTREE